MIDQLVNAKVLKNRTFIISDSLNHKDTKAVTHAKAGVHKHLMLLDSRVRGNDENGRF